MNNKYSNGIHVEKNVDRLTAEASAAGHSHFLYQPILFLTLSKFYKIATTKFSSVATTKAFQVWWVGRLDSNFVSIH